MEATAQTARELYDAAMAYPFQSAERLRLLDAWYRERERERRAADLAARRAALASCGLALGDTVRRARGARGDSGTVERLAVIEEPRRLVVKATVVWHDAARRIGGGTERRSTLAAASLVRVDEQDGQGR